MDQSDCRVDEKLAADLKCEIMQHLKDKSIRQLRKDCEAYDQRIREAWETIQTQMASFNQRKDVVFSTLHATLRDIGDKESTQEAIWPGLDEIVPPTYKAMTDAMRGRGKSRGELPTPVTSPSTSNALNLNLTTPDTLAGSVNARSAYDVPSSPTPSSDPAERRAAEATPQKITPPKALFAKRTRPASDRNTRSAKKPKASSEVPAIETKNGNVEWWEVEGVEYIFEYPPFGPGWFVLRCELGPHSPPPHIFTLHPFQEERAHEHYNNCKSCKGHDTTRSYELNDIVMSYGRRVNGANVNREWVKAANLRLEANTARMAGGKGKAKKQPEMVPANRPAPNLSSTSAGSPLV